MPGVFVAFDGPDGTGKSTQCRLLVDHLRGIGVAVTAAVDPGGTPLGQKLRDILLFGRETALDTRAEALLFMASRAQLVADVIRPALERGEAVVSDRYVTANVVYQGHAGGLDPNELWSLGVFSAGGVMPARTVVFDVPPEVARTRRKPSADRFESRGTDYLDRVRQGFLTEAAARPATHVVVDATPPADAVHAAVWAAVSDLFPGVPTA